MKYIEITKQWTADAVVTHFIFSLRRFTALLASVHPIFQGRG